MATWIDEFFGEPISSYSSRDAIEDGYLHHLWPERWPWLLITDSLYQAIEDAVERQPETGNIQQRLIPLVVDFIREAKRLLAAGFAPVDLCFSLHHTAAGTVWAAANEHGGLTLMLAEDM